MIKPPMFFMPLFTVVIMLLNPPILGAAVKGPVDLGDWQNPKALLDWQRSDSQDVSFVPQDGQPTYLHVVSPPGADGESADIKVPIAQVAGSFVAIRVEVRAQGVTQPARSYNGIKVMLHVTSPSGGDTWDQASANGTSFPVTYDWSVKQLTTMIPADATGATLVLGLQESLGSVDFRNLHVEVVATAAMPPRHPASSTVFTGHGPGALRGVMISPDIQPEDVATLKAWHVNLVR